MQRQPDSDQDYVSLAVAYGYLGRPREAEAAVAEYNKISVDYGYPPLNVQEVGYWWYGNIFAYDEDYRERLREGCARPVSPKAQGPTSGTPTSSAWSGTAPGNTASRVPPRWMRQRPRAWTIEARVRRRARGPPFNRGHIPSAVNLELRRGLSKVALAGRREG